MERLKYSEVIDFIVSITDRINSDEKYSDTYVSLPLILEMLRYEASFIQVVEISEYLEAKGYVRVIREIGDVLIQITTKGKLHREELGDEFELKVIEFIKERNEGNAEGNIILTTFEEKEISDPKEKIFDLIEDLKSKISNDKSSIPDNLKDLEIITLELRKVKPDFRIIDIKIDELTIIPNISQKLRKLRNYIIHDTTQLDIF